MRFVLWAIGLTTIESISLGESCGGGGGGSTPQCPRGGDGALDACWLDDPHAPRGEANWSQPTREMVRDALEDKKVTVDHLSLDRVHDFFALKRTRTLCCCVSGSWSGYHLFQSTNMTAPSNDDPAGELRSLA